MDRLADIRARFRATGADLPYGDPERAHDVAMEGYFWRITDPGAGRVVIALIGVNRGPRGPWATVAVATSADPGALVEAAIDGGWAASRGLAAGSGHIFLGDDRLVRVRLPNATLDARLSQLERWPHRRWGGSSIFQAVPGLNQYWHPWLLGGTASGTVELGGERWSFADAQVYGEKNWGRGGFPDSWWWGQAHGFGERAACVVFAGGKVYAGPLRTEVTALVVRLPDERVIRLGNPVISPVRADVGDGTWSLRGVSPEWEVDVDAHAAMARAHILPVPLPAEHRNTPGALEHLAGHLAVTVRRRGTVVWSDTTELAGLEHGGLQRAEAELARRRPNVL